MNKNKEKEWEVYFVLLDLVLKGLKEGRVRSFSFDVGKGTVDAVFINKVGESPQAK